MFIYLLRSLEYLLIKLTYARFALSVAIERNTHFPKAFFSGYEANCIKFSRPLFFKFQNQRRHVQTGKLK